MLKTDAAKQLKSVLQECSAEQFGAVKTILVKGAGCLGLPEGAYMTEPQDVAQERRDALWSLTDAVYLEEKGDEFTRPRAGMWESVLATLVIEQDWETIKRTAAELTEQSGES